MQNFSIFQKFKKQGYQIIEVIQSLWSGYGQIVRLADEKENTLIAKHINPPATVSHPRGWNTNASHQRKLKSYEVELEWYRTYAKNCHQNCRVPNLIALETNDETHLIILEDLDANGYASRKTSLKKNEIEVVLSWLANFHATFLGHNGKGLWPIGTYWHLATRQEEYHKMEENKLKKAAHKIDEALNSCQYQTLVHGDAKVANFCFAKNGEKVAAVDFQYVGKGCGMKDVIYFLGSCLTDDECAQWAATFLDYYFSALKKVINEKGITIDVFELELEWRKLYAFAWADFHRFLLGWMPNHQKLTSYSNKQVELAISKLPI